VLRLALNVEALRRLHSQHCRCSKCSRHWLSGSAACQRRAAKAAPRVERRSTSAPARQHSRCSEPRMRGFGRYHKTQDCTDSTPHIRLLNTEALQCLHANMHMQQASNKTSCSMPQVNIQGCPHHNPKKLRHHDLHAVARMPVICLLKHPCTLRHHDLRRKLFGLTAGG
jgi:hypothetical protein